MPVDKPTREQLKEWNKKLADEGLSVHRGHESDQNHTVYVDNPEVFQTKPKSGRLARYKLGERVSHRKSCVVCERSFTSKRNDAITCSKACRNALFVLKALMPETLRTLSCRICPTDKLVKE